MSSGSNNWMTNLHESIKNKPLIYLAIPGAHDCMTYTISPGNEISPDNEPAVEYFVKVFGKLGKKYIYKWCVTQDLTISEQLKLGIRYLDFRVATKSDSKVYFCHGLFGDEISKYLEIVNNFLKENKGEVVIMDFQHFYHFSGQDHQRLIKLIKDTFGDKLCPFPSRVSDVSLTWMLKNGYQSIVIYRDKEIEEMKIDRLWPGPAWRTPWPNTSSVNTLKNFLKQELADREGEKGYVTQCLLTPDAKFLALHPFSNLKKSSAMPVFKTMEGWLTNQHPGPDGINVVLSDFVSVGSFYNLVIGLNNFFLER